MQCTPIRAFLPPLPPHPPPARPRRTAPSRSGASARRSPSPPSSPSEPPPPPPRTKWTRRVPHPVLIGHAASLGRYRADRAHTVRSLPCPLPRPYRTSSPAARPRPASGPAAGPVPSARGAGRQVRRGRRALRSGGRRRAGRGVVDTLRRRRRAPARHRQGVRAARVRPLLPRPGCVGPAPCPVRPVTRVGVHDTLSRPVASPERRASVCRTRGVTGAVRRDRAGVRGERRGGDGAGVRPADAREPLLRRGVRPHGGLRQRHRRAQAPRAPRGAPPRRIPCVSSAKSHEASHMLPPPSHKGSASSLEQAPSPNLHPPTRPRPCQWPRAAGGRLQGRGLSR